MNQWALEEKMRSPAEGEEPEERFGRSRREENFMVEMEGCIARGAGQAVLSAHVRQETMSV